MSLQIMPTLGCNFKCEYCYEKDNRHLKSWDSSMMDKLKTKIVKEVELGKERVVLHGGEVTTLPIEDFRNLIEFTFYLNNEKHTSMQTNGFNITEEHIEIFKEFKTDIGISIDGPFPINNKRGFGDLEEREQCYNRVMDNIRRLRKEDIKVSIISIINENHMGEENTKLFIDWLDELQKLGINSGRMNMMDKGAGTYFTHEDAIGFYKTVGEYLFENPGMKFSPIRDMIDNLLGLSAGPCGFTKCNMDATQSCKIIHGDLQIGNCLHPARFKEEVPLRDETSRFHEERDRNLRSTPREEKGCQGCKYYEICYGGCPSLADDDPLTERSSDCKIHYRLYEWLEGKLKGLLPLIKLFNEQDDNPFEAIIKSGSTIRGGGGHTDRLIDPKTGKVVGEGSKGRWKKAGSYSDHTDQLVGEDGKPTKKNPNIEPGKPYSDHTDEMVSGDGGRTSSGKIKYPKPVSEAEKDGHTDRLIDNKTGEIVKDFNKGDKK